MPRPVLAFGARCAWQAGTFKRFPEVALIPDPEGSDHSVMAFRI